MLRYMGRIHNFLLPFLFAAVMVLGIKLGFELNAVIGDKPSISSGRTHSKLDELMRLIEVKYVDTVSQTTLIDDAINEVLSKLDPHSFYIPSEDLQAVNESLDGNFEGIGIEFYIVKDTIIVVSPISGGPSEALGIRSGDKIITIEDSTVAGVEISNKQVVDKLRGPAGSVVRVGIARSGIEGLTDYNITRDKIPLYSLDVGYMVDDSIGYIKINRFSATTYNEFMEQLRKLNNQGMRSLIVDLRQNPGGYLNAATMIADEFIAGNSLLVYTQGKAYDRTDYNAKTEGEFENGKLAIIIDEGSASASEILAGAVQDWDRGLVVGRRSFGKGLVQEQYDMSDKSAVRLTVARYYTPSGRCIQKPYDEGSDEYFHDLESRFESGELYSLDSVSFPDSLKYYTPMGRVVYGGGGIMPDIFVPLDTTYDYITMGRVQVYIPQFVYNYYANHQIDFKIYKESKYFKENFTITPELYSQFEAYARAEGLKVEPAAMAPLEQRIKTILKAHFARQLWKEDGFYPVINSIDPTFQRTYDALRSFDGFERVERDEPLSQP